MFESPARGRRVAIGLGSSIGCRARWIALGLQSLAHHPDLTCVRSSRLWASPPMRGGSAKGWFLNAVGLFRSELSPQELLAICIDIEDRARRRRAQRWGDRTLDLDLLVVEGATINEAKLQIPHPGIGDRDFVLRPLLEVWPGAIRTKQGKTAPLSSFNTKYHAVPVGILAPNKAPVTSSIYRGTHPSPTLQRYRAPDGSP